MGFSGWPLEAVEFFRGLQADNTKRIGHPTTANVPPTPKQGCGQSLSVRITLQF